MFVRGNVAFWPQPIEPRSTYAARVYDRTASQWWDELSDDDRVALVYAVDSNRLSRAQWEKLAGAGIAAWEWRADRTDTAFYLPARFRRYVLDWANDAAA